MGPLRAHGEPPRYFTFPALEALGLPHATTTRHCPGLEGDARGPFAPAAVATLRAAGLDLARVAWARQVHGAAAARVAAAGGFAGTADVLVSTAPGVALAIFTADCLALTLWDPTAGALAVAHVGWRGLAAGATEAAVAAVVAAGARPARLRVAIAPAIGPCCYEVDAPVADRLARAYGARWTRWARATGAGRWRLDLGAAVEDLLVEAGVAPTAILNARLCTACHPELLFSYRKGHRGRLATLAALP